MGFGIRRQGCTPDDVTVNPAVQAVMVLSETTLLIDTDEGGSVAGTATIAITSTAGDLFGPRAGTITYTNGSGWLSTSVDGGNVMTVTCTPGANAAGAYVASFPVTDANATAGSNNQTVTVTMRVNTVDVIQLRAQPTRFLNVTVDEDGAAPTPYDITVLDPGGGTLAGPTATAGTYPSGEEGWLSKAITSNGDGTYNLRVQIDQTGLVPGASRGVFVVSDTASDEIIEFIVDLTVQAAVLVPVLAVSPSSFTQNAEEGDGNVYTQQIAISNSGTGTLAGPVATVAPGASSWLSVSTPTGSGNAWSCTATLTTGALIEGDHTANITITDANAASPATVAVTFTVGAAAEAQPAYGSALLPRNPAGVAMVWDGANLKYTGSPISFDYSAVPTFNGTTHSCTTRAQVDTALNACVDGDIIEIAGDITITSSLVCRNRGTGGWVWIRSNGHAGLPTYSGDYMTATKATNRLDTTAHAASLQTITTNANNVSVWRFEQGASGYWFTGLEITTNQTKSLNAALVEIISNTTQTQQAHQPSRIVLDRCWIHGPRTRRGVNTSGRDMLISGCVIDNIDAADTSDSQAIGNINGGQHLLAFNNELEAVSEPIFSGSGGIGITNQDPSDMAFIRNYVHKRAAWDSNTSYGEKKNMFEMKHGVRVLYFGQRHDHYRVAGQFQEFAMTPSSSYSWGTIKDVTIHGVYSTDSNGGWLQMNPQGSSGTEVHLGGARFTMAHCYQAAGGVSGQSRIVLACGANAANQRDWPEVTIEHNTLDCSNTLLILDGSLYNRQAQWVSFRFANNVNIRQVEFGPVFGSNGTNTNALNLYLGSGNWTCTKNGIVTGGASFATGGSLLASPYLCFQDSEANIFTSPGTGDFTILSSSPYAGSGTDGMDPGADIDWVVNTLTAGVA
jgi:hypothetical protein